MALALRQLNPILKKGTSRFFLRLLKCNFNYTDLRTFKETVNIFNKYEPIKTKYACANVAPFMTRELHKAIMKRSRLRNKFLPELKVIKRTSNFKEIFVKNTENFKKFILQ